MWNEFRNRIAGIFCLGVLLGQGSPTLAWADERLQLHGFLTQTLVHTDANNFGGESEDGVGVDMRELGLNTSYRLNGDWLFSGQVLARWAGNTDDGDLRVDYAFVDRTLYEDPEGRFGIQVGKVKNPFGLYNTTRDVAHTRPGLTMPQSIYLDRVRNFFLASPGASLYGNHVHGDWDTSWRLNIMRPEADNEDLEHLFFLAPLPGHYEGKNSWLGQILFDKGGGRLRVGLSVGQVASGYKPGQGDFLGSGEQVLRPIQLSLEWNAENWSLTSEYEQVKNRGKGYGLGGLGPEDPNTVEAWYLQGTWRLTPSLRAYLRRDVFYFDKDDRSGARFAASNPGVRPYLLFSKDWVLGVRQDWMKWSLSAEIHNIEGTAWLSPLDTSVANQQKDWNMLLLQAAYRF